MPGSFQGKIPYPTGFFQAPGIDFPKKMCYFFTISKAVTKTRLPGKIPREEPLRCNGSVSLPGQVTTSEPHVRKCHAGYARYCVNE